MKQIVIVLVLFVIISSCAQNNQRNTTGDNKQLAELFQQYNDEQMSLFPVGATLYSDDGRYNNLLAITFTGSYRQKLKNFYTHYLDEIEKFDTAQLNENDRISYGIFKWELSVSREGLAFHNNYTPFNQFEGMPLNIGILGAGTGMQPFKTIKDYDNWIERATAFSAWADSAIVYFRKGIASGWVLPKALVVKMIPQMYAMVTDSVQNNLFYGPVKNMPASFSQQDKQRLTKAYQLLITQQLIPAYKKLGDFLKNEYLPKARTTAGVGSLPGGDAFYRYRIRMMTSSDETPDEIYNTGLAEVSRIHHLMDSVKSATGFNGDMKAFLHYLRTDKKFMPYKTPEDVLNAFRAIRGKVGPHLKDFISLEPKSKFEIRQTEAFRAASASVEYWPGSPDGSRPGIIQIPVVDATQFNDLTNEDLFLHEGIPGHHIQIALQLEDTTLPRFRRTGLNGEDLLSLWNAGYVEGWALYCEDMGKTLGCYTDPYQYMGYLRYNMHRAIRLVVDVGMHFKGMTREAAIQYSMDNEPAGEDGTVAEIERYMAYPAQALCYKVGELKILGLKDRYTKELGSKFNLLQFHDELLKDGAMPLELLEKKMDRWAEKMKNEK